MASLNTRITKALQQEFIEGTVYRIDLDHVDVAPDGSSGILRSLPLTGDRDKIKPGDPIKIITVAGERLALAGDIAFTDAEEFAPVDASEIELMERVQGLALTGNMVVAGEMGPASGGDVANKPTRETFTATAGQTSYTLTASPIASTTLLYWNGVLQRDTTDYSVSGTTVTTVFSPAAGDIIDAFYYTFMSDPGNTDTVDGKHAADFYLKTDKVANAAQADNAATLGGLSPATYGSTAHIVQTNSYGEINVASIAGSQGTYCKMAYMANWAGLANGAWTTHPLNLWTEAKPAGSATQAGASRLVCQVAGVYIITANVAISANATGDRGLKIMVNGSEVAMQMTRTLSAGYAIPLNVSVVHNLDIGNYVEMSVFQNSGVTLTSQWLAYHSPVLGFARIA